MKLFLYTLVIFSFLSCSARKNPDSYVWGILTDNRSDEPVRNAPVWLNNGQRTTLTDSNGFYLIDSLTPGTYTLEFRPPGHQWQRFYPLEIGDSTGTELNRRLEPSWLVVNKSESFDLRRRSTEIQYDLTGKSLKLTVRPADTTRPETHALQRSGGIGTIGLMLPGREDVHGVGAGGGRGAGGVLGGGSSSSGYSPWWRYRPVTRFIYDVQTQGHEASEFYESSIDSQSTFAADMSTASYTWTRRIMMADHLVASPALVKNAARAEEFINYFDHDYPAPDNADFSLSCNAMTSPYDSTRSLLRLGLKTRALTADERKPLSIVLVVDVSGSMDWDARLGTVRATLFEFLGRMNPADRVALVTYGTKARVVSTFTSDFDSLRTLIKNLEGGGSTDVGEGLKVSYSLAADNYSADYAQNILLCTDGVATKGQTTSAGLLDIVKANGRKGIRLTALGFGANTYNDAGLSSLATHGDGQYYYLAHRSEARRLFHPSRFDQIFRTVAEDVTLQVTFDPHVVAKYRLIGYEKRDVADQSFGKIDIDGAELGSRAEVTALYEITWADSSKSPGRMSIRYRKPGTDELSSMTLPIEPRRADKITRDDLKFTAAVALFADILRAAPAAKDKSYDDVIALLAETDTGFRVRLGDYADFAEMVYATKTTWKRKQLEAAAWYWE